MAWFEMTVMALLLAMAFGFARLDAQTASRRG